MLMERIQKTLKEVFPNNNTRPRFFRAPGRVNLIGEHTDYNNGFVLPVAINFETIVAAIPRSDTTINIFAADKQAWDQFDLTETITPHPDKPWANYVRGMAKTLLAQGKKLSGLDMVVAGNVPTSGGLSSSASFEMALGHAFLHLNYKTIDGAKLALSGQKTENDFVGVQCGIMDQFISALGQKDHALLIDCQDLSYKAVPIPPDTAIIIADSGIERGLVDSEYNMRREQCEAAATHFKLKSLRELDRDTFADHARSLPAVVRQRARHVITENSRTLAAANALTEGNMKRLGLLMDQSHLSMQYDFEITLPAIDTLVEIMQNVQGVYGARMTGGGFGGCCVALAPLNIANTVKQTIEENYQSQTAYKATVYQCKASAGAGEIFL